MADKCVPFGMKKAKTKSVKYQPKLLINSELVSFVCNGSSLKYLGGYFDFQISACTSLSYTHTTGIPYSDVTEIGQLFCISS